MCGICGILHFDCLPVNIEILQRMVSSIAHRGPDDRGTYVQGEIGLGHCRLSIIDLSSAGRQPMQNENGSVWITYNGEIYNFPELKQQLLLMGHIFSSNTDTEVIIHAYEEWGMGCLDKLNGMFAFALWDTCKKTLYIARDRIGVKFVYYFLSNNKLVFASEIKSILVDETITREINAEGLINFFTYGSTVSPNTIYRNIYKLPPGHFLICSNGSVSLQQYWDIGITREQEDKGLEYYMGMTYELLNDSVQKELISDVPLGVFLSGGMDSSSIVALMSRTRCCNPIKTYSIGFNIRGAIFNELDDANIIAKQFNTDHNPYLLDELDLVNNLHSLVYYYDEPFGDVASFPTYLVSKFARKQVKVCLSGEGGDELFGGYRKYVAEKFIDDFNRFIFILHNEAMLKFINALPRYRRLKTFLNTIGKPRSSERYSDWLNVFTEEMLAYLLEPSLKYLMEETDRYASYKKYMNGKDTMSLLGKAMYADLKITLPETLLEKVDKASMSVGLETRVPFLDHRLVEFAFSIPSKYKIRNFVTKFLFRKAMQNILPKKIVFKPKFGFAVPIDIWFFDKLKEFLQEILLDNRTFSRGILNKKYIQKILGDHISGRSIYDNQLWMLLVFELWCREYIDRK